MQKQECILLKEFLESVSQLKLSPKLIDINDITPENLPGMVVQNVNVFRVWAHLQGSQEIQICGVFLKSLT